MIPARPTYLLALCGEHGAGKDSAAAALHNLGWNTVALADALRHELCEAFQTDERFFLDRTLKELPHSRLAIAHCIAQPFVAWAIAQGHDVLEPRSPRWLMQRWGNDWRRAASPAHWWNQAAAWIDWKAYTQGARRICVIDLFDPGDEARLRALGGKLLRVHRPQHASPLRGDTRGHASTRLELLKPDGVIVNDGGMEHLQAATAAAVAHLFGPAVLSGSKVSA